jgi:hypothetical protein
MSKQFIVVDPPRKSPLVSRARKSQPPKVVINHVTFGPGAIGLHESESGGWLAKIRFGNEWRVLQLRQEFFTEPIASVIAMAGLFAPPKPKHEPAEKKKAERAEEDFDDVTPELGMEPMPETEDADGQDGEGGEEAEVA